MTDWSRVTPPRVRWAAPGDAAAVAARIEAEVRKPGEKRIAFTGGSTPLKVLALLATRDLDWSGVTIALTDDRCVPDDHPASNFGKIHAALGATAARFERLGQGAPVAPFDLVWLGMGEDGHVASLFPNAPASVVECETPYVAVRNAGKLPRQRISLSYAAIAAAAEVWVLVSGPGKEDVFWESFRPGSKTPLARILQLRRHTRIFTNIAAGQPL